MKIKTDWNQWLHNYRKRELYIIFSRCPKKVFKFTLEIGAGDGFQSKLLNNYTEKLISTDINPARLKLDASESIEYKICDAERLDDTFEKEQFDLVFSSNLLEHVPNPSAVLSGIYHILKNDGLAIHVLPNRFWKLCQLLFFIPHQFIRALEILTTRDGLVAFYKKIEKVGGGDINNQKICIQKKSFLYRLLMPMPHGISFGHPEELFAFSKRRWIEEFRRTQFEVIAIKKGPVQSGYGFGFDCIRNILEKIGFYSENIYVTTKRGKDSPYRQYFNHKDNL